MNNFNNKKILVTGHTGFKGSWLCAWLKNLGSNVIGLSNCVPTNPSHYEVLNNVIDEEIRTDVRDRDKVASNINKLQPDFIFHLAAQPIVFDAYQEPFDTFEINVMGTASILEYLRQASSNCVAIFITSDKCYDNVEWTYGYRESDKLGGNDPYSGSKGAAELVIKSYFKSFLSNLNPKIKIGIGRAGNVIGGGDWAPYRIVPDCVRSWSVGELPEIRCPQATRPWQHVLEPLSGYLNLGMKLHKNKFLNGEAFNFGPMTKEDKTVKELLTDLSAYWDLRENNEKIIVNENKSFYEATLLKLNCEKSQKLLNWYSSLDYEDTIRFISEWYVGYYKKNSDMNEITNNQILNYQNIAKLRSLEWTA